MPRSLRQHAARPRMRGDYEQAAVYRDQIRALSTVQARQYVDTSRGVDADVVACAIDEGIACVNLVMIRSGRHLGDKSFFPQNAEERTGARCSARSSRSTICNRPPPALIVDGEEVDARSSSRAREHAGRQVQLVTRPQGERRAWLEMARKNARLALAQRAREQSTQEVRLAALREALGPAATRCSASSASTSATPWAKRRSPPAWSTTSAGMQNSEYRRYNIAGIQPGDDYAAMRQVLHAALREGVARARARCPT